MDTDADNGLSEVGGATDNGLSEVDGAAAKVS